MRQSTIAYNNAESALEQALMINATREHDGTGIGTDLTVSCPSDSRCVLPHAKYTFTIKGLLTGSASTLAKDYIIPFPWTGNAPWKGQGSKPTGGCDAAHPPRTNNKGAYFYYPSNQTTDNYNVLNHPCNWNTIKVGQKVSIPLYAVTNNGKTQTYKNITSFSLRLRTPCYDGSDFCNEKSSTLTDQRWILNCFDKGTKEELCGKKDIGSKTYRKGEVVMIWQIDVTDKNNKLISFLPYRYIQGSTDTVFYKFSDSELYEGKINKDFNISNNTPPSNILTQKSQTVGPNNPNPSSILKILNNPNYKKPVLKLSLISNLIGCKKNKCSYLNSGPKQNNPRIPYLAYQIDFGNTPPIGGGLPGPVNIITATGSKGAFSRTIEVKVPHESSNLEYVIQQ
ncbi:MAG TPA: hypothetical protein ENI76_04425 [Ignavibacteria bacterium]|nr:hypothetical protein [Ignavibacteria bacterium]